MIQKLIGNKNFLITLSLVTVLIAAGIWTFLGSKGVSGLTQDVNKVALPAKGNGLNAQISEYFGRAPYFIVYDVNRKVFWTIPNPFVNEAHAVGLRAGTMLVKKRVGVIVCKNIGPEPIKKFNDSKIEVYIGAEGTVADGIKQYKSNQLILTTMPNVPTHYGLPGQHPCPNVLGQPKKRIENPMNPAPHGEARVKQAALNIYDPQWNGWTIVCSNCKTIMTIPYQGFLPPQSIICPYCKARIILGTGDSPARLIAERLKDKNFPFLR
ncbi:MAG TPA: NifB/NifX family molybdenum-iron cluster-binding protein [bacterium]|nr:NifB/NifX family molybdenum-iron cluster-binding protein [bacterium]